MTNVLCHSPSVSSLHLYLLLCNAAQPSPVAVRNDFRIFPLVNLLLLFTYKSKRDQVVHVNFDNIIVVWWNFLLILKSPVNLSHCVQHNSLEMKEWINFLWISLHIQHNINIFNNKKSMTLFEQIYESSKYTGKF